MKMLLLITTGLLFFINAYAQILAPVKTLNCTEEAITFKASIGSGWQISSFRVGNMAPVKSIIEDMPGMYYPAKALAAAMASRPEFQNILSSNFIYFEKKKTLQQLLTFKFPSLSGVNNGFSYSYNKYDIRHLLLKDSTTVVVFSDRQMLFATK